MLFLSTAAHFSAKARRRQLFTHGRPADSDRLRRHLALRYHTSPDRVFLYHTGRSALAAALLALFPPEKGQKEIIINGLTCYAVVAAVRAAGHIPIYADIDLTSLHFTAETLKPVLKRHPKASGFILQNNLGYPADIIGLERLAKKHNLTIIEDLAHSVGLKYPDRREAGTVGSATVLSFGKGKAIDLISGGALILTAENATLPPPPVRLPSFPDRLRDRLYPTLGLIIRGFYRLKLGRLFTSLLIKLHLIQRSADAKLDLNIRLPHWQARLAHTHLKTSPRLPLREFCFVDRRPEVLKELSLSGFHFDDTWYDSPIAPARYFPVDFPKDLCPNAVWAAEHLLNLPTHYPKSRLRPARKIIKPYRVHPETLSKKVDL